MHKLIKSAIILGLTVMTQVASSQWTGQFDQYPTNMVAQPDTTQPDIIRPDPRYPPRARIQWYSAGEARTNKIVNNEFTFRPRLNARIERLRLVGTASGVLIRSVVIYFGNGQAVRVRQLEGRLRSGQRFAVNIGGRFIREIRVVATSESLIGSRGRFRVDLGVLRY